MPWGEYIIWWDVLQFSVNSAYLYSVGQSCVQHGEDGQVGAQVRNHSAGGALQRRHGTHSSLDLQLRGHASLCLLICVLWIQSLAVFNWVSRDGPTFAPGEPQLAALWVHVTAQENVHMTHKRPWTGLLLLSYNPGDQRPFETRSAPSEAKDRFGYLPCRRYSTHTEANQLSGGSKSFIKWKGFLHESFRKINFTVSKTISHEQWSHFPTFLLWNVRSPLRLQSSEIYVTGLRLMSSKHFISLFSSRGMSYHLSGDRTPLGYLWRNVIHSRLATVLCQSRSYRATFKWGLQESM